ncbi:MAG: FeoA family protein [Rhodospirillaceae bacterium]
MAAEQMAAALNLKTASSNSAPATKFTVADLIAGQRGTVVGIAKGDNTLRRRLTALGIIRGTEITLDRTAPLGNPRAYSLLGYLLSLRNEDARNIQISIA